MEMLINIPDNITEVKAVSQGDIVLALAIQLYVDEEVSLAKAADIAGLSQFDFQKLLATKNIPLRYNTGDLERELETVKQFISDSCK
jgi:predicted HTH domain antitoxin